MRLRGEEEEEEDEREKERAGRLQLKGEEEIGESVCTEPKSMIKKNCVRVKDD